MVLTLLALCFALLYAFDNLGPKVKRRLGLEQTPFELSSDSSGDQLLEALDGPCGRPEIRQDFLSPNKYSRSRIPLLKVRGIVVHYVANPGSSAKDNRDYFEGLAKTHETKASSHFVIGLDGEILQCIPLDEIAYASNRRNGDTISIECCHPGKNGKFTKETREALVRLTSWLCATYDLKADAVIRHYDVTGKMCPLYYVKHEDAWINLREEIGDRLKEGPLASPTDVGADSDEKGRCIIHRNLRNGIVTILDFLQVYPAKMIDSACEMGYNRKLWT